VRHQHSGRRIEAVHQQTALVIDRKRGRPTHRVEAAASKPAGRGLEQGIGDCLVVLALEEAEEADPVPMDLRVEGVLDGRDPAYNRAGPLGEEVLGSAVLEEWVLLAVEKGADIAPERRNPDRVRRVQPVG
jgi:hypothetical protein